MIEQRSEGLYNETQNTELQIYLELGKLGSSGLYI
jgi:hypothetical protein